MEKVLRNFMVNMTVKDMNEALARTKTVIIPVGCTEQHGYHLPLSTDINNAEMPVKYAGERLNAVVAPTINYCFSGGELAGTVNVSPQVFGLYVSDICCEFARMGFKNIILLLGHGGTENKQAMTGALQSAMRRSKEMHDICLVLMTPNRFSPTKHSITSTPPQNDFHAGWAETSAMLHWAPQLVRLDELEYDDEELHKGMRTDPDFYARADKAFDDPDVIPYIHQKPEVKIGVMGFPEKGSAEIGKKIQEEMVEGLIQFVDKLNARLK